MGVSVTTSEQGPVPVVHVQGDVDVTSAPSMREAIDALILAGHRRMVLDLTDVSFIDSTGLGVVVGRLKGLRRSAGVLTVAASHERVLRVLGITGLDTVLDVAPDVDAAIAAAAQTAQ
ncbi:hypothetical protein GCM10027055_09590 [Janibacter alkaliphilus]|uniref:Anti-sigma factor antagonist n=1 Tax=Janibacter alkaliphilus TaxID=1069963 RepID=A0A852X5C8_9MICO|nr:STAS domain-containing protein [Janibacter alkaliphilus]NYG35973.1 anti-sigma B factor antagonist [Janibacter alkaliphilus]